MSDRFLIVSSKVYKLSSQYSAIYQAHLLCLDVQVVDGWACLSEDTTALEHTNHELTKKLLRVHIQQHSICPRSEAVTMFVSVIGNGLLCRHWRQ